MRVPRDAPHRDHDWLAGQLEGRVSGALNAGLRGPAPAGDEAADADDGGADGEPESIDDRRRAGLGQEPSLLGLADELRLPRNNDTTEDARVLKCLHGRVDLFGSGHSARENGQVDDDCDGWRWRAVRSRR